MHVRNINIENANYSRPLRGTQAGVNGRPWSATIGMPYSRQQFFDQTQYEPRIQPLQSFNAAVNGFQPLIVQAGGARNTRYVFVENLYLSRPLRGSAAAINGSGQITGLSSDVMVGLETMWPELEYAWWSPPLKSFHAAINTFTPYNPATDAPRVRQKQFFDEVLEQKKPLPFFLPGPQGFIVYNPNIDMVRARQSKFFADLVEQYKALQTFPGAINSIPVTAPPPTYGFGSRWQIYIPPRPFTITALTMQTFDTKDPTESIPLVFNFGPDLLPAEQLFGAPIVTVTVLQGVDPAPSNILNGLAGFDTTLTRVIVPVRGGISGVLYEVAVICPTTNTLKVLTLAGALPVRTIQ